VVFRQVQAERPILDRRQNSPEEIRRKILQKVTAEYPPPYCDQWACFFTELTGVEAPDLSQGCFPPGQRGKVLSFEGWFAWLEKQR
jgi:hypothetical protein